MNTYDIGTPWGHFRLRGKHFGFHWYQSVPTVSQRIIRALGGFTTKDVELLTYRYRNDLIAEMENKHLTPYAREPKDMQGLLRVYSSVVFEKWVKDSLKKEVC